MMNNLKQFFGRHADIVMVLVVLGVLVVLFMPIPSGLLDFLILANFSFAFLIPVSYTHLRAHET